jgi:hypothetical protein
MQKIGLVGTGILGNAVGSTFTALDNVIPSDKARANIVIWRFIASFTPCAVPFSPKKKTLLAMVSKTPLHLLNVFLLPAAIITKSPVIATFGPPITGVSNITISFSKNFSEIFFDSRGLIVLISHTTRSL